MEQLRRHIHLGALATSIVLIAACTKLHVQVYDQNTELFDTPEHISSAVGSAYAGLRNFAPGIDPNSGFTRTTYYLDEISTDEVIVPTRGNDWIDNNYWKEPWMHTWNPNSLSVHDAWLFIYGDKAIPRINRTIEGIRAYSGDLPQRARWVAELRCLRALYMFHAVDLFGNVPIPESTSPGLPTQADRSEAFDWIVHELTQSLPDLSTDPVDHYGSVTAWFAEALLAKLYLNAEVYTGKSRWQECKNACDAIITSGKFSLEADYFANFRIANEGSRESIFSLVMDRERELGYFAIQRLTLHYNSAQTFGLESGGVNGFCSTADFLDLFPKGDKRRRMFITGQQFVGGDSSHPQTDNQGNPLYFEPSFDRFAPGSPFIETAGARCGKWEFNKSGDGTMSNDLAIFRLADIILMKAEAQFRSGDISGAVTTLNQPHGNTTIHGRAGLPPFTDRSITADSLLAERARELAWEGWRRNDMIRLGHFLDARTPEKRPSAEFRKLFPIPQEELDRNRDLVQNPGY